VKTTAPRNVQNKFVQGYLQHGLRRVGARDACGRLVRQVVRTPRRGRVGMLVVRRPATAAPASRAWSL
jgi:hypothetical protein